MKDPKRVKYSLEHDQQEGDDRGCGIGFRCTLALPKDFGFGVSVCKNVASRLGQTSIPKSLNPKSLNPKSLNPKILNPKTLDPDCCNSPLLTVGYEGIRKYSPY